MAVKLNLGLPGFSSLTSPPGSLKSEPDPSHFQTVKKYEDRTVYVSQPFPDSLELICPVLDTHTAQPDISGKSWKEIYKQLDQELMPYLMNEVTMNDVDNVIVGKKKKTGDNPSVTFNIRFDPKDQTARAFFTLSRKFEDGMAAWTAKLELSAWKAGPAGLARIEKAIAEVFSFRLHKMLPDMRISRLDAAIDLIGVEPLDLIGHAPEEGKRMVWVGDHGRPESIYFFKQKAHRTAPPLNLGVSTKGPQRLTLYERSAMQRQLGFPPTYGDVPVTRAEVSKRWTKDRPHLKDLLSISNLFEGRRVAYAAGVQPKPRPWIAFCMAALGAGVVAPRWYWSLAGGAALAKAYADCEGDLVNEESWNEWVGGLTHTGLIDWVAKANKTL